MKKKLLLINPWIYDFKAYDFWIKPLGLLYIADFLQKYNCEIYFINCLEREPRQNELHGTGKFRSEEVEKPLVYKDVLRKYKRYGISVKDFIYKLHNIPKPDYILITSIMTYWYLGVKEVISLVKEVYNDVPIILGGIYATLCYEHAKNLGVDYVIKGGDIEKLYQIIFKEKFTSNVNLFNDFRPAYELLENKPKTASIISSIGCPFKCSYCASNFLQPKFFQRNPLKVAEEIVYYVKNLGIKNIAFSDDALLVNYNNHLSKILNILKEYKIQCNFHTPNGLHARYINEEVAFELFNSNFKTIRLGLETTNELLQQTTGNKVKNSDIELAINYLHQAGFTKEQIGVYLMIGLPGQSIEDIKNAIYFINSLGAKIFLATYSPIPHTEFYKDVTLLDNEPLLHNNTYQFYKNYPYEVISELSKEVKKLNEN